VNKRFAVAGMLAVTLASQSVYAKTLEDILKEKGVITEEDYKTVTKSKSFDYKPGKGFTLTDPDEKFQLSLGGSMQLQYAFTDNEVKPDVSEFRLRRIKTTFNGYAYTKDLTYKMVLNWAEIGNGTTSGKVMEETFLNYKLADAAQLMLGQDKVQFARQEITSSGAQQFVDRSFVVDAFKPSYDTGLNLHGDIMKGRIKYDAGIFGGAGQSTRNLDNMNALNFRIAVNPFGDMKYSEADLESSPTPLMSVGASYYMNELQKTAADKFDTNAISYASSNGWLGKNIGIFNATEKVSIDQLGIDAAFKWQGLSLQGEYFWARGEGNTSNKDVFAQGFYAQAGYFILPKHLEIAMRYAWMDPNRDLKNNLTSEIQGAVSYYFFDHNLKLQADMTNHHENKDKSDNLIGRIQAQLNF